MSISRTPTLAEIRRREDAADRKRTAAIIAIVSAAACFAVVIGITIGTMGVGQ